MRNLIRCAIALVVPAILGAQAEQTAEQAYKNIQVLKGVPVSQFMNTMFFQRYALGVSCSYCHVDGKWEADDKPAKAKARQMQRMVMDLNKNVFHENKVNCVTCHRGSVTPQTEISAVRLSFDQMLGPRRRPTAPARDSTALPSVSSVFAKYIAALGGRENLAKITSTATKGNLITSEGRVTPFEESYESAPNRWVYIRHFAGSLGDFSTGYDGTTAWNKDNRGLTIYSGLARARSMLTAETQTGLHLEELYANLKVTGVEMVGTSQNVVLSGTAKLTGLQERLYFDMTTGLLARRSTLTESLFGAYSSDMYFENYQSIDGVMIPTLVSQFSPDDGTVRKLTSVEHNAKIDPALFAKPEK
jgi:photosynthetic reaction center cytochrome c subunit